VGRGVRTVIGVTISVVLRVADAALAAGRLAGEAELVATGERAVVRDAGELISFLRRSPDRGAPGTEPERVERGGG
jgi:hypothetical protein